MTKNPWLPGWSRSTLRSTHDIFFAKAAAWLRIFPPPGALRCNWLRVGGGAGAEEEAADATATGRQASLEKVGVAGRIEPLDGAAVRGRCPAEKPAGRTHAGCRRTAGAAAACKAAGGRQTEGCGTNGERPREGEREQLTWADRPRAAEGLGRRWHREPRRWLEERASWLRCRVLSFLSFLSLFRHADGESAHERGTGVETASGC
jgi:hypothetical protein